MSAGSFLKKVGLDALRAVQIGTEIIPFLQPFSIFIPKIGQQVSAVETQVLGKLDGFQSLFTEIQQTEQDMAIATGGASGQGPAKTAIVAAKLPGILQTIELIGGKSIGERFNSLSDDKKKAFNAQCGKIVGDAADLLNILES